MHLKRALITGASSGLGEEFARQLARRKTNLILVARRKEALEKLAVELKHAFDIEVDVVVADLADPKGIASVVKVIEKQGDIDLLINNAGFGVPGNFHENDFQRELDMVHVHVVAVTHLTRAVLKGMTERRQGGIINIASVAGFGPTIGSVNYNATKAYLIRFSEGLAVEMLPYGIVAQALCPGFIHTGFHYTPELENDFDKEAMPGFLWMDARKVVARSLEGLHRGETRVIPGLGNQILAWFAGTALYRGLLKLIVRIGMARKTNSNK